MIRKKKKDHGFLKDTLDTLEKATNQGTINLLNRDFRNEKNMTTSASQAQQSKLQTMESNFNKDYSQVHTALQSIDNTIDKRQIAKSQGRLMSKCYRSGLFVPDRKGGNY